MKTIIVLLLFAVAAAGMMAQHDASHTTPSTKEKKESEEDKQYLLNKEMLENRDFVLEANYLQDHRGNRRFVNHMINFVQVDSTTAIIQVGSDYRIGPNGVGGITAKGRITNWKLTEDKKSKTFSLYINVMTQIGIYDLFFRIYPFSGSTASLTGLSYGQLTFEGELHPYSESSIYEGQSL
jgi:hypothetical protein